VLFCEEDKIPPATVFSRKWRHRWLWCAPSRTAARRSARWPFSFGRHGEGLAELRRASRNGVRASPRARQRRACLTRARHRSALERALAELEAFWQARALTWWPRPRDALRAAVVALDDLIGAVTPEDVLDRVFATFCVGK